MYYPTKFYGSSLPAKTLCLTFDDGPGQSDENGPGPKTVPLAEFLHAEGIRASFFVVGKFASKYPGILKRVSDLGHLICNHTYDHPNLAEYVNAGGDAEEQILRTDATIKSFVDGPTIYFRAPYGLWPNRLDEVLNKSMLASLNHVGPIHWDNDGADWESWLKELPLEQAVQKYLDVIGDMGRGIILNHDCTADIELVKNRNRTYELMLQLIPALKAKGFQFVRLDEISNIAAAAAVNPTFSLRSANSKYITIVPGTTGEIAITAPKAGPAEKITAHELPNGKIVLKGSNQLFFSPVDGGGSFVQATASAAGLFESFDLIQLKSGKVAFRTVTGHYLSIEHALGGRLMANTNKLQPISIFTYAVMDDKMVYDSDSDYEI